MVDKVRDWTKIAGERSYKSVMLLQEKKNNLALGQSRTAILTVSMRLEKLFGEKRGGQTEFVHLAPLPSHEHLSLFAR